MKTMIVCLVLSGMATLANAEWSVKEKYDRKFEGWVKGGSLSQGQVVTLEKVSGKIGAPTALHIRQKNLTGELEIKKSVPVPADQQGRRITVEALVGYNFVNEYVGTSGGSPGGNTWAFFMVRLLDKRGEKLVEKSLSRDAKKGGDLEGTQADMAINRMVFEAEDTAKVATIQVVMRVKVEARGNRPKNQTCMSEFWIQSLTIQAEN